MEDSHQYILDIYYWEYIDRGEYPEDTPLVKHQQGVRNLTSQVASALRITTSEAEAILEMAIAEVEL